MSFIVTDTPSQMECGDCKRYFVTETLTTYDRGDKGFDLTSLCDKCLSKYPKKDSREWRREEHPDQFGIVKWMDGSKSFVDSDGMLRDVYESDSGDECCSACFVVSHDVQRGFATVAVPEGCGDEDCDCHNQAYFDADGMLQDVESDDEFHPSLQAFVADVPNHALAFVCVLIIMGCVVGIAYLIEPVVEAVK